MKHFLLRSFWWVNYTTKFAFLLLAVTIVCVLVESIFKKKLYPLYIAVEIAAFIIGIRMGLRTFHILEFSHPVITVVGACCLKVPLDIIFAVTLSGSKSSDK